MGFPLSDWTCHSTSTNATMWFSAVAFPVAIILFVLWRKKTFSYFKAIGLKGPTPHLIWGNYLDFKMHNVTCVEKWRRDYGDTFGAFWGDRPVVVSTDLDLLEKVCIKGFSKAPNRMKMFALDDAHPVFAYIMSNVRSEQWKRQRKLSSPSFTTVRMKEMVPLFERGISHMMDALRDRAQSTDTVDIYPFCKRLTLDNIGRTGFGIENNSQKDPDNVPYLLRCADAFVNTNINGILDIAVASFALLGKLIRSVIHHGFKMGLLSHSADDMCNASEKIVQLRYNSEKRNDLLQSLVDAEVDIEPNASDGVSTMAQPRTLTKDRLSACEVTALTAQFVLAGYETTSTALAFLLRDLAKYPVWQERIRQEIMEHIDLDKIDYTTLMALPSLDCCVRESLRIHPPITSFVTRESLSDIEHGGIRYPAGVSFLFPVREVHHDPRHWPRPAVFDPTRFAPENKAKIVPNSFLAFGAGPRNCIGMRMALVQIKYTMCQLLSEFRIEFEQGDNSKADFVEKLFLMQPSTVVIKFSKLVKRGDCSSC